jgi:uridine phosphorylase
MSAGAFQQQFNQGRFSSSDVFYKRLGSVSFETADEACHVRTSSDKMNMINHKNESKKLHAFFVLTKFQGFKQNVPTIMTV